MHPTLRTHFEVGVASSNWSDESTKIDLEYERVNSSSLGSYEWKELFMAAYKPYDRYLFMCCEFCNRNPQVSSQ